MSYEEAAELLDTVDGVLVPGGFGSRGWEGKILACQVARERRIPYLGICLGMHVAVSEFARHVVGLDGANSTEMDPETPYPVIDLLPEQKGIEDLGGPMRLGAQAVEVADGTPARELFVELAAVRSPPGEERAVADTVLRCLRALGREPDEDDCGAGIGSTMGNVYARLEPTAPGTPLFFCAHLDTVPLAGPLEPV